MQLSFLVQSFFETLQYCDEGRNSTESYSQSYSHTVSHSVTFRGVFAIAALFYHIDKSIQCSLFHYSHTSYDFFNSVAL